MGISNICTLQLLFKNKQVSLLMYLEHLLAFEGWTPLFLTCAGFDAKNREGRNPEWKNQKLKNPENKNPELQFSRTAKNQNMIFTRADRKFTSAYLHFTR